MLSEVVVAAERARAYLLQVAAQPEWAGWLKVAQTLSPHSGPGGGKAEDSYRWDTKTALWGTAEQWRELGYIVNEQAQPRLVLVDASKVNLGWELIYSEKEVVAGLLACPLRAPRGSKTMTKAPLGWKGDDPSPVIASLETLLLAYGWKIYRRPDARGAESYCKFVEKEIWVQRSGDLWTDFHRLAHESGHALLHQPEATMTSLWQGETEAEGVAMLWGEVMGVDIMAATAQYILYRSTGHPYELADFQVDKVAFSDRTIGVVSAGLEMIQDLDEVSQAREQVIAEEYDARQQLSVSGQEKTTKLRWQ